MYDNLNFEQSIAVIFMLMCCVIDTQHIVYVNYTNIFFDIMIMNVYNSQIIRKMYISKKINTCKLLVDN